MRFTGKSLSCEGWVSLGGFTLSDRWRTLHANVLQAGGKDSACQFYKLLRVTNSGQWL